MVTRFVQMWLSSESDLLDTVENIVTADKRQTPFTNNRPGETWYKCFLKRHPELALREPEGLTKRKAVDNRTVHKKVVF